MDVIAEIQKHFEGTFPGLLGVELSEVSPERIVGGISVRPDMCTLGNYAHGGAIMGLADTLGAVGTFINLPQGARTTTIESKTNFLGAAAVGSRLIGQSTPVHIGKKTMVWQTQVKTEDGKLVALVIQTQMIMTG